MRKFYRHLASAMLCIVAGACVSSNGPGSGQAINAPTSSTSAGKAMDGATLRSVRARGHLNCGVNLGLFGFGAQDSSGRFIGFDVDYCRAVAAAIFGDAQKVSYHPVNTEQRFVLLQSGQIDMLARNSVWTLSRDSQLGLEFSAINFYDGQGFMVRRASGIDSVRQLGGTKVCVQAGTTTEWTLRDYARRNNVAMQAVTYRSNEEARLAYDAGTCDAYTSDGTALAGERTALADPSAHVILPERISKEPLAPVVRQGDNQWSDILRWTHFVLLTAEELNLTAANVDSARQNSTDPTVRLLLGKGADIGRGLGLGNDWAYQVIRQVGNYGEIFRRNLTDTIGIERALNAAWSKGGLQFAPPIR